MTSSKSLLAAPKRIGFLDRMVTTVAVLLGLMITGGATCNRGQVASPFPPPPPIAISSVPTIEEVAAAVNRNDAIRELSCNSASIEVTSMPSLPKLKATMHARRDRDFRLRANVPLVLGSGIDIGSNAESFWFEVPEDMLRKTMYFARHDQYAASVQRTVLPINPTWLMDAIGLVRIDPSQTIAGPLRRADGAIEIHQRTAENADGLTIYYVDPTGGYVTDQFVYDSSNRLIASSTATGAVYYPADNGGGVVLPHQVELSLAPESGQPMSMRFSIGRYSVNQLLSGEADLFVMPNNGSAAINLAAATGPVNGFAASPTLDSSRPRIDGPPVSGLPSAAVSSAGEVSSSGGSIFSPSFAAPSSASPPSPAPSVYRVAERSGNPIRQ